MLRASPVMADAVPEAVRQLQAHRQIVINQRFHMLDMTLMLQRYARAWVKRVRARQALSTASIADGDAEASTLSTEGKPHGTPSPLV